MTDLAINKRSYRVFILPFLKASIRFSSPKGVAEQFEAVLAYDAADRLGMITASTLVITGTEDRVIKPTSSEVIADLVPNAKLVRVLGGGHIFNMEMSGEFNRKVLDFLRNLNMCLSTILAISITKNTAPENNGQ